MLTDAIEQRSQVHQVARKREHIVGSTQYQALLISRRKLERVPNEPERLHDRESDEIFVLRPNSDASVPQSV